MVEQAIVVEQAVMVEQAVVCTSWLMYMVTWRLTFLFIVLPPRLLCLSSFFSRAYYVSLPSFSLYRWPWKQQSIRHLCTVTLLSNINYKMRILFFWKCTRIFEEKVGLLLLSRKGLLWQFWISIGCRLLTVSHCGNNYYVCTITWPT